MSRYLFVVSLVVLCLIGCSTIEPTTQGEADQPTPPLSLTTSPNPATPSLSPTPSPEPIDDIPLPASLTSGVDALVACAGRDRDYWLQHGPPAMTTELVECLSDILQGVE